MKIEKLSLDCVTIEPPQKSTQCIIWLHGLGADANDFTPIIPYLDVHIRQNTRFIFPNAPVMPVTINGGYAMRAWFDILEPSLNAKIDQQGINDAVYWISELIEKEIALGIKPESIFLGGFSQGAVIALMTGLQYPHRLAGIIALSGYLPFAEKIIKSTDKNLPIFIAHGSQDPIVPYTLGLQTKTFLEQAGYPVTWYSYSMPHTVCPAEIADIDSWIREKMR